jgi:DNA adenine methylase
MFSWIGGKSRIGKWIKDYIPNDVESYCEPFGGAFWVYFNLTPEQIKPLKKVVYNDINPLNSNLFLCIKNHKEFYEYIKDIPAQEKDRFNLYQENCFKSDFKFNPEKPDYEIGLNYIYVVTQVFSGTKPEISKFVDLKGKYKSKFDTFKGRLNKSEWIEKIDKITHVENLDFEEVIKKHNDSYFYIDAPYFKLEDYYSKQSFNYDDHVRLAKVLSEMDNKISVSYYPFEGIKELYDEKWNYKEKEFSKPSMARLNKIQTKGTELLILNYNG